MTQDGPKTENMQIFSPASFGWFVVLSVSIQKRLIRCVVSIHTKVADSLCCQYPYKSGWFVVLSVSIQKRLIRCVVSIHTKAVASSLSSSGGSHVSTVLYHWRAKKWLARDVYFCQRCRPRLPYWYRMLGKKIAALTIVFSPFSMSIK